MTNIDAADDIASSSINLLGWEQVCDLVLIALTAVTVVSINLLDWELGCDLKQLLNPPRKQRKYQSPRLGARL